MTGNDIKNLRLQRKETQAEFAKRLDYSGQVHISRLESRKNKKIPASAVARIKAAEL